MKKEGTIQLSQKGYELLMEVDYANRHALTVKKLRKLLRKYPKNMIVAIEYERKSENERIVDRAVAVELVDGDNVRATIEPGIYEDVVVISSEL